MKGGKDRTGKARPDCYEKEGRREGGKKVLRRLTRGSSFAVLFRRNRGLERGFRGEGESVRFADELRLEQ